MNVHNHGPEEGPGLACRETRVDGVLRGACLDEQVIGTIGGTPVAVGGLNIARAYADHIARERDRQYVAQVCTIVAERCPYPVRLTLDPTLDMLVVAIAHTRLVAIGRHTFERSMSPEALAEAVGVHALAAYLSMRPAEVGPHIVLGES